MKRIVFINRYYFPDQSATSRVLTAVANGLQRRGFPVSILTSDHRYEDPAARLPQRQDCDGVQVYRLATSRFGRHKLVGRGVDYLGFIAAAFWWLLRHARSTDVVVCKTDPPMLSGFLWPALAVRRATLVNWLQDLFPEVAVELGVVGRRAAALPRVVRNLGLKRARFNVVIGELMAARLKGLGVPDGRLRLIENTCDVATLSDHDGGRSARQRWGVGEDRFVVMYSGNLGRAHPHQWIADLVVALAGKPDLTFVFAGGGAGMAQLQAQCGTLEHCLFLPYQPEDQLANCLAAADLHLVALQPTLEGLIVPSKFYPVAAVGRGVVYLGARRSDVGRYLMDNQCGEVVSSSAELSDCVQRLADKPDTVAAMGQRAGRLARQQFSQVRALARWESMLADLNVFPAPASGQGPLNRELLP